MFTVTMPEKMPQQGLLSVRHRDLSLHGTRPLSAFHLCCAFRLILLIHSWWLRHQMVSIATAVQHQYQLWIFAYNILTQCLHFKLRLSNLQLNSQGMILGTCIKIQA